MVELDSWCAKFENSTAGAKALEALDKAFPPEKEGGKTHSIRRSVLRSCYGAAMFDKDRDPDSNQPNDPSRMATQARKSIESDLPLHKSAITNMRRFARKHPHIASVIFQRIIFDLIAKNIRITDSEKRDWVALMNCVLEIIQSQLAKPVRFDWLWPPPRPFDYGCLRYDSAHHGVNVKHHPEVETMLLFDLVQTFRLRSRGVDVRRDGTPMPPSIARKPYFKLATIFVNAVFLKPQKRTGIKEPKYMDIKMARYRLKALSPSLSYCAWPALR